MRNSSEGPGILVFPQTITDKRLIAQSLEDGPYLGYLNAREGTFFYPEDYDYLDAFDRDLSMYLKNEVGAAFRTQIEYIG